MSSFNYKDGSGLQISNTDYAMCVRMERNFCGIQYTACIDLVNSPAMSFSISSPDTSSGEAPQVYLVFIVLTCRLLLDNIANLNALFRFLDVISCRSESSKY